LFFAESVMKSMVPAMRILPAVFFLAACAGVPTGRTTALHQAADTGDLGVVENLIVEESAVDARDETGRTALHRAAMAGDMMVTAALLDAGADPNLTDREGKTPLHYAVLTDKPDLVAMILGAEANPMIEDKKGISPLALAESEGSEEVRQTVKSSM
jgi:ankyrin repeat protein